MTSVKVIDEATATGKTKSIYEDIRTTLGLDFVPNMYKVMAVKPDFLEANWNKVKAVMKAPGKLDALTKEIIAVAVSAVSRSELAPRIRYAQWGATEEDRNFRETNSEPITQPDFFGARSSSFITMLREGHEDVELNDEEFERLITWADNNVLFYGTFDPQDQDRQLRGESIEGPLVD